MTAEEYAERSGQSVEHCRAGLAYDALPNDEKPLPYFDYDRQVWVETREGGAA